jgi:pantothenate kinase
MLLDDLAAGFGSTATRRLIGIAGAPGSGKSTLADGLADRLGPAVCVVVPMDGFHLANTIIEGTPLRDRKGAIDTFDAAGYLSMLRRLRSNDDDTVYAPAYVRGLEEPIAASIAVPRDIPIVLSEGNYLLSDHAPWPDIRAQFDEVWFVDTPDDLRREWLVARHVRYGMTPDAAAAWADGPDAANARLVAATRERADRILLYP